MCMTDTGIGAFVRARRDRMGWTQERLSQETGISRARIAQIEGGRVALPGADARRRLATALGVSHLDLLIAAEEIRTDEIQALGVEGVANVDPVRADLLERLQRVRLDRERIKSLDYFLDLFLSEDREASNRVEPVTGTVDNGGIVAPK